MMALWPNDVAPTHIIACNEQGSGQVACSDSLADGSVANIVASGLTSCDRLNHALGHDRVWRGSRHERRVFD